VRWIDKPAGMGQSDEDYVAQAVVAPAPAQSWSCTSASAKEVSHGCRH